MMLRWLWRGLLALIVVSLIIAYATAPGPNSARDAQACGVDPEIGRAHV